MSDAIGKKTRLVLIVAGEASADLHGSNLVRAMKRRDPTTAFWGIGGERMEKAGVKILFQASDMAVVGLTEVFSRLHCIVKAHVKLKHILKRSRPDLLILIDYPEFNINLAKSAKRNDVPVLYYISPQIWAWRRGRIKRIAKRVDRMAVILPFEEAFYRERGLDVDYVGHPLLDSVPHNLNKHKILNRMELEGRYPILGLLPGSRSDEIRNLLPLMIKAVDLLSAHYADLKCVLPLAPTISPDLVQSVISQTQVDIRVSRGNIHECLIACDLALVASGTATLEAAIMGVPMIIVYRVSPITYRIGKMVIKVPYIGLVNLVAGDEVVPELIQNQVTPGRLAHEALNILESRQKKEDMIKKLKMVGQRLGSGGASEKTARIAIEMMDRH